MMATTAGTKQRGAAKRREQADTAEETGLRRIWRDYGLSIAMFALFAVFFVGHTIVGWMQYAADQASHGDKATVFGDSGYVVYWGEWTLQNWQSEFLQSAVLIVFAAWWIHRGSAESKDGQDEMQQQLQRIESRLDELAKKG